MTKLPDFISELQSDDKKFVAFVDQPQSYMYGRGLNEAEESTMAALAVRTRTIVKFAPTTLFELSNNLDLLESSFGSADAAFGDNYTDNYSDIDHFSDNYTNSEGRMGIDRWTRSLVLERGLDISSMPGSGFSGL